MKKFIIMALSLWLVNGALAHEVLVKVALSPAGNFEARSAKLAGTVKREGDKFMAENLWVTIKDLKTGIELRDEHFHKYLSADKSPRIVLSRVAAKGGKGVGILMIGNKKNPQVFSYKALTPNKLEATFKVKASAFGLKKMEYMGIEVEDEVEVVAIINI